MTEGDEGQKDTETSISRDGPQREGGCEEGRYGQNKRTGGRF